MDELELEVESLDTVPEDKRGLYKQVDGGKYRLPVKGLPDVSGVASALAKERSEHKATKQKLEKIGDLDVDAARTALAELEELKRQKAAGTTTAAENQQIRDLTKQLEQLNTRVTAAETKEREAAQKLVRTTVENALKEAAIGSGVQKQYLDDVCLRAGLFGMNPDAEDTDNPVIMVNAKGEPVLDGGRLVTPQVWLEGRMAKEKPGWFAESGGGGARGSRSLAGRAVVSRDDSASVLANIKSIAEGKTQVQ